MPSARALSRVGVIDVGSNSVRLVVFDGAALGKALAGRFQRTWSSEYAYPVDLCEAYEVPRIGD